MHRHSDATLMGLTKKELVEYVRIAEYNRDVAEETVRQQAENVKDWMPVVRCKDCKHFVSPQGVPCCDEFMGLGFPNADGSDFCSYGEKKDND